MTVDTPRVPAGLPEDYYARIYDVEQTHWWHVGLRRITAAMIGARLRQPGVELLDAGCGTGGFLRWAMDAAPGLRVFGADLAAGAIELARNRVPEAELSVAPMKHMPYESSSFDLVVSNDVLQHVPQGDVLASLRELRRVIRPDGTLLLRTNGARRSRAERADWRVYDRASLVAALEAAGFECEQITYVNLGPSLVANLRGKSPRAPTEATSGIPRRVSRLQAAFGSACLGAEARYLARGGRSLPYGHTQIAVARPTATA